MNLKECIVAGKLDSKLTFSRPSMKNEDGTRDHLAVEVSEDGSKVSIAKYNNGKKNKTEYKFDAEEVLADDYAILTTTKSIKMNEKRAKAKKDKSQAEKPK